MEVKNALKDLVLKKDPVGENANVNTEQLVMEQWMMKMPLVFARSPALACKQIRISFVDLLGEPKKNHENVNNFFTNQAAVSFLGYEKMAYALKLRAVFFYEIPWKITKKYFCGNIF